MQTLSAKDAKYGFGRLIDLARAEPVAVAKHGRPVVVVVAIEEYGENVFARASGGAKSKGQCSAYLLQHHVPHSAISSRRFSRKSVRR